MRLPSTFLLIFFVFGLLPLGAQTETIRLDHAVYFASASHEPDAAEMDRLLNYADQLTSYAGYTLQIEAFTDEQGSTAYNKALAERRAATITKMLREQGVEAVSTEILAYGEGQARKNTTDDAERRTDRRVDLVATVTKWTDAAAAMQALQETQRQRHTIDPTQREVVRGAKGGIFIIDPDSFVDADGNPITEPVEVELIEAYEFPDILLLGLTTTSNGRILETGGMIKLEATTASGQKLQLREGVSISSSIPTQNFNTDMQFFQGDEMDPHAVPTNWQLTENPLRTSAQEMLPPARPLVTLEEHRTDVGMQADKLARIYANARKSDYYPKMMKHKAAVRYYSWLKTNAKPVEPIYVSPEAYRLAMKPGDTDTVYQDYQAKGLDKIFMSSKRKDKIAAQRQRSAKSSYNRKLKRYERSVAYRDNLPQRNAALRQKYVEDSTAYAKELIVRRAMVIDEVAPLEYALGKHMHDRYEEYRAAKLKAFEEGLANAEDLSGRSNDVKRYFFSLTNLGWANCDMFLEESERVEVLASLPGSTRDARMVLLPEGRSSVIPYMLKKDGSWGSRGIPAGLGYRILAYEVRDGQLVMAHHRESAAANGLTSELTYEPVAITDLRERLAGILGSK